MSAVREDISPEIVEIKEVMAGVEETEIEVEIETADGIEAETGVEIEVGIEVGTQVEIEIEAVTEKGRFI